MNQQTIQISTNGRGFYRLDDKINACIRSSAVQVGLCNLFIRHTSASLLINENADPDVLHDLETFMSGLVTDGDSRFRHSAEGADDMPAHIRSALTQTSLTLPIMDSILALGTWQSVFLWEHRYRPHSRSIVVSLTS